jgi:uncharacterized lipoprotein YddW (UPF0748 family)
VSRGILGIMKLRWRGLVWAGVLLVLASSALWESRPRIAEAQSAGEVRALWVDAFHGGIKSPAQVEKLVADARRANVNTLLVQVRRRGDLYYQGGPEPRGPEQAIGHDGLRALLNAARSGSPRLEVHAWIPAYPIWSNRDAPPPDPSHPFNRHGPTALGEDNWLLTRDDGETWAGNGYWLDPGHPTVSAYLVDLATDLVQRYDVDGVHLDYIRYPQDNRRWGYNEASVLRFNGEHGRAGQPDPNDPLWVQYRRDRVSDLVRRIRESTLAIRPALKLSAAVIGSWGPGPRSEADWLKTAAYSSVFQDWRGWLEQGLLDQAYVMSYFREFEPLQSAWLDQWLDWNRGHTYGRQVVPGLAAYLNTPSDSVRQLRRALAPGLDGSRLAGVALYSYATPDQSHESPDPADDTPEGLMWDVLARPAPENDYSPPFAEPVAAPAMPWKN